MTREGRYLLVTALMGGIVGYLLGLNSAYVEMTAGKLALQQSRAENQKMKSEMTGESVKTSAMESGIAKLRQHWTNWCRQKIPTTSKQISL